VTVDKTIPVGAGLGGGSSNAAFILNYLAEQHSVDPEKLPPLASHIGSDVSFFLHGGLCRVTGKGEIVRPLPQKLTGTTFLIVYPNIHISTSWAYSIIENPLREKNLEKYLTNSEFDVDFLKKIVYNKFQIFVLKRNDALLDAKRRIDKVLDSRFSFMSGSGSSLVYVYSDRQKAAKDREILLQGLDCKTFLCDPLYR
jgi:4-diphosphocytidyl-2-C-methyl-D-erythritol kinase